MKLPGPDHPIEIAPKAGRVKVLFGGRVIADTTRAVTLKETTLPPVLYIPREDTMMALLTRTDHSSHCPYKGDASYFTVSVDGKTAENAVWSYEHAFPAMAAIEGRLAFYPSRVEAIQELAA